MIASKGPRDISRLRAPAFFYGSAREAFRDFLRCAPLDRSRPVLLPAFIGWSPREGSGVLDPVVDQGFQPTFYQIADSLTSDADDFEKAVAAHAPAIAVLIHYYGRTDPHAADIRRICRRHGVPLVEDSAHAFFTALAGGAGSTGDVNLYAFHKMLPMSFGGAAIYHDSALIADQCSTHREVAETIFSYNWHAIAHTRRKNYAQATALLRESAECGRSYDLPWPDLDGFDVPQSLPLLLRGVDRDRTYRVLNERGIGAVSLYHTLVDAIGPELVTSHRLARAVINLPIHQDLVEADIDAIVREFVRAMTEQVGR